VDQQIFKFGRKKGKNTNLVNIKCHHGSEKIQSFDSEGIGFFGVYGLF